MNNLRATVYQRAYPMILKLQFEIFLEIGHDFKLLWYNIFYWKTQNKLPLEPYFSSGTDSSRPERISTM